MPQLNIKERNVNDVTIADLVGKITMGEGDVQLREAVRRLLSEGRTNIVLNLEQVSLVDSSGIGELVSSYTTTSHRGGKLKLLKPSMKVRDLLHITQLITVFETFDDENEAVSSFN